MCATNAATTDQALEGQSPLSPSETTQRQFDERVRLQIKRWEKFIPQTSSSQLAVVAALCAIFLATSFYRLNHTDLWAHLAYGRWIEDAGSLPTADPLRTVAASETFINVPWLTQIISYQWWQSTGPGGLQLAHVIIVTLSFALMMLAIRRRGISTPWAVAAALTAYILALPITGVVRPQLFGLLAFTLFLTGIACLKNRWHPLVWLPIVFALWANLHGSFVMGLLTMGCLTAGLAWDACWRERSLSAMFRNKGVRRVAILGALCLAAVCINPLGHALLWHVTGFGMNANLTSISEWSPTVLPSLTGGLFYGSLLFTAILLRISPRRIRTYEVLLLIVFGVATLMAIRMLIWWALLWPFIAAPHAAAIWQSKRAHDRVLEVNRTAMGTLIAVSMVFVALVWSPIGDEWISGNSRSEATVVSRDTPLFLADEIERRGLTGLIYTPMAWSDYLLWHSQSTIEPMVYSHVHLVTPETWNDHQVLSQGGAGWLRIIEEQQLNYLVLQFGTNGDLRQRMRGHDRFRTLYQDQQGMIVEVLPSIETETKPATQSESLKPDVKHAEHAPNGGQHAVQSTEHLSLLRMKSCDTKQSRKSFNSKS